MKRLFYQHAAAVINQAVLDFFDLEVNKKCDIANPDKMTTYAVGQGIKFALRNKYPTAKDADVNQFVSCIVRNILHISSPIIHALIADTPSLKIWQGIIDSKREDLIKRYAGSQKSNEDIYIAITEKLLMDLEQRFFVSQAIPQ